jgi:hypothetical protein
MGNCAYNIRLAYYQQQKVLRSTARPSPSPLGLSFVFLFFCFVFWFYHFFYLVRLFYITDESATLSGPASYPLGKSVGYETWGSLVLAQTNTTTRSVGSFGAVRFEVVRLKLNPLLLGFFPLW